jgi:hypothetical protein
MKFTKIKHNGTETELEYFEQNEKGTIHENTVKSKEAPDVALPNAFKAFVPLIAVACDLPEKWEQGVTVTQLSFSTEHVKGRPPRRGVIVTFQYKPDAFLSRMTCNTPLLKEAIDEEDGDEETKAGIIPKAWAEPIAALEAAAARFMVGDRLQQAMPLFAGAAK